MTENRTEPSLPSAEDERHLRARLAKDTGHRVLLDDVLDMFGFDRADLEAELAADQRTGRI